MPRSKRRRSEAEIYHVIVRGEGRMNLFEDDEDRMCFMNMLTSALGKYGGEAYAWCLMSNHVHLLLHEPLETLSRLMQSVVSGYAVYFNKRHDHVGHVFSNRFTSQPIEGDEYLITAVVYIHQNPVRGGVSPTCDYRWSSFRDYASEGKPAPSSFVIDVFGGLEQFLRAHAADAAGGLVPSLGSRRRLAEDEAREIAVELLGANRLSRLSSESRETRNEGIAMLRRSGLTAKQVERLTGIGRGIVNRVKWR